MNRLSLCKRVLFVQCNSSSLTSPRKMRVYMSYALIANNLTFLYNQFTFDCIRRRQQSLLCSAFHRRRNLNLRHLCPLVILKSSQVCCEQYLGQPYRHEIYGMRPTSVIAPQCSEEISYRIIYIFRHASHFFPLESEFVIPHCNLVDMSIHWYCGWLIQ